MRKKRSFHGQDRSWEEDDTVSWTRPLLAPMLTDRDHGRGRVWGFRARISLLADEGFIGRRRGAGLPFSRFLLRSSVLGGYHVIRKEAELSYRTSSSVRL